MKRCNNIQQPERRVTWVAGIARFCYQKKLRLTRTIDEEVHPGTDQSPTQPTIPRGSNTSSPTQPTIPHGSNTSSTTQPTIPRDSNTSSPTQPTIPHDSNTSSTTQPTIPRGSNTSSPTQPHYTTWQQQVVAELGFTVLNQY